MQDQLTETSKFLSYVLRHKPESVGIALDGEGWADIGALLAGAARAGKRLNRQLLQQVVDTNDKKRFTISEDGLRIRAAQGHSTRSVDISYVEKVPPELLYHGTATRYLDAIRNEGLVPGSRQYVHLSQEQQTAVAVGKRHGKPVVLTVEAGRMHRNGATFYQADNGVWLVKHVPRDWLRPAKA